MACDPMKRYLKLIVPTLLIVGLMSLLACRHFAQSSPNSNSNRVEDEKSPELSLLRRYDWTAEGEPTEGKLQLPRPVTAQLSARTYLQASKAIGLDFSDQAGQTLTLRNYKVTNAAERGHD